MNCSAKPGAAGEAAKEWLWMVCFRFQADGSCAPTTWEVRFELPEVSTGSPYKLRIATAAANGAAIQVNYVTTTKWHVKIMDFGIED